ncbi:MAG: XRE family transcriptional regulator [Terriglobales bacterium]
MPRLGSLPTISAAIPAATPIADLRDSERILQIQQPRVSELMRGKLSTLSVARLLLYADRLGAEAQVKLKEISASAA